MFPIGFVLRAVLIIRDGARRVSHNKILAVAICRRKLFGRGKSFSLSEYMTLADIVRNH